MKKCYSFLALIVTLSWSTALSQEMFDLKSMIVLPDTVTYRSMECADMNSDGRLDVVVLVENAGGDAYLLFYDNSGAEVTFQYSGTLLLPFADILHKVTDANDDGRIDLLISGNDSDGGKLVALINDGAYTFSMTEWLPNHVSDWLYLNNGNDGRRLLLTANGSGTINNYRRNGDQWDAAASWDARGDQFLSVSLDNDHERDLVMDGQWQAEPEGQWLIHHPFTEAEQIRRLSDIRDAVIASGDVNYNGIDDLLVGGETESGEPVVQTLRLVDGELLVSDTLGNIGKPLKIFLADLTSDGVLDVSATVDSGGELYHKIFAEDEIILPGPIQAGSYSFGDLDRDGDLDMLQYSEGEIGYFENTMPTPNLHPSAASRPILAQIFDRLFLSWRQPTDDHTPVASITYDVQLSSGIDVFKTSSFDASTGYRLTTSEGNNGTSEYVLTKREAGGPVEFKIQSVDNSFYGAKGGICIGNGEPCAASETQHFSVCGAEKLQVAMSGEAEWYSFAKGYLGTGVIYSSAPTASDTLFGVVPGVGGACPQIKVIVINRESEGTGIIEETAVACEDDLLEWNADPGWSEYSWHSTTRGLLSNEPSLSFSVGGQDTVTLEMSDGQGCSVIRRIAVVESAPDLSVEFDSYQIVRGGEVRLAASGAEAYEWSPSASLDDPHRSDPVATPSVTTTYTVIGVDSIGCTAAGQVLVRVEETAFIPQMFTPNNDGTNDVLKIYGLGSVDQFVFRIFNREGGEVYSTSDPQQAATTGWNGWANGILQPSGVYHWKVEGRLGAGVPLSLNGKVSGSVMLVR